MAYENGLIREDDDSDAKMIYNIAVSISIWACSCPLYEP
jgi:hypothetical protein